MHALTIARRNSAVDWKFMFKTSEAAERAYATTTSVNEAVVFGPNGTSPAPSPAFEIADDFGQRGRFVPGDITGVLLENLDESRLAHIEHALHEMRTRATIQQRMASDATLKFAMGQNPGGPAVISPMSRPM